jgi:hypothetical protein
MGEWIRLFSASEGHRPDNRAPVPHPGPERDASSRCRVGSLQEDTGSNGQRFVWRQPAVVVVCGVVPGQGGKKSLVRMEPHHRR